MICVGGGMRLVECLDLNSHDVPQIDENTKKIKLAKNILKWKIVCVVRSV